jgi:hypothetical protein
LGDRITQDVLEDWRRASVSPQLRRAFSLVEQLTLDPASLSPAITGELAAAGVSPEAARDAVQVCYLFNTIDRLADAFGFALPEPEAYARAAKVLLKRGYVFPGPWRWEVPAMHGRRGSRTRGAA